MLTQHYHRIYFFGTVFCITMVLVFALTSAPWLAAIAVFLAGFGAGCFSVMQSTIILLAADPDSRSRLMGVLSVCIGTGPIGFLHLGWMADTFTAPTATAVMAAEGLVVLTLLWFKSPAVR